MKPLIAVIAPVVLISTSAFPAKAGNGTFSASIGLTYASVQTTTISGAGGVSTSSSSTNVTGTALGAEYLFNPKGRLSFGPSLLVWHLPGADSIPATSSTAVGLAGSYRISTTGSARVVVGNQFRFGYTQSFGQKGLYAIGEIVVPNKNQVDSFGYVGLGYRFK